MKVFAISHSSVVPRFRTKWAVLADTPGLDLTLLVPRWWPEAGGRVRYTPDPTARYRVLSRRTVFTGIHALHFYPDLAAAMLGTGPDIVHVEEEPWNLGTFQAAVLARLVRARLVFFTWENVRRRYPFPLPVFAKAVRHLADAAIAGSLEAATILREQGFRRSIHVVPQYGVDPSSDSLASPAEGPPGTFTVGFAGRLIPEKGLDSLVDAVAELPADVRLLLVGDGTYRDRVVDRARTLGLQGRLELTGVVPHAGMTAQFRRMDVLVLPSLTTSRWKEQFGRVLVEAMALGIPVVGSSSGEIPDVIADAGLVFPEGHSGALAACLRALRDDHVLRKELAERGRVRAHGSYSTRAIAEATRGIYRGLAPGAAVADTAP